MTLWHGATHAQVPVPLSATQIAFVVATFALPLLGASMLWTTHKQAAAWLIAVSLLASLLFGFINRFVISGSSDYGLMISAGASWYSFILSAALLVIADTLGVAIGIMAALSWRRPT